MTESTFIFPVGLEQGPDGAVLAHSLSVPGCVSAGVNADDALAGFADALAEWLEIRQAAGAPVPPPDAELEIVVEEWIASDADVSAGESSVCFEADLRPLDRREISDALHTLGDLRGRLLRALRSVADAELDQLQVGGWTVRRIAEELARAQWWTLSRLGASPLAEVPQRTLGRLDTAMALIIQQFADLAPEDTGRVIELEGEEWTPRKVLRRLLWLEWMLGRSILHGVAEVTGA